MMTNETLTLEMKFFEKYFDIQKHLLPWACVFIVYRHFVPQYDIFFAWFIEILLFRQLEKSIGGFGWIVAEIQYFVKGKHQVAS